MCKIEVMRSDDVRGARMSVSGIGVLYFLIIVVANAVGSVSGMGGGVIIKPVLDFVGHDSEIGRAHV